MSHLWPNWYDPRVIVVRDVPEVFSEAFTQPQPEAIEPPTRSTVRPEIYKEFLPGVPKDKYGIPVAGSEYNPLPASAIPKKETKVKPETKETKETKVKPETKETKETFDDGGFYRERIHNKIDYAPFAAAAYKKTDKERIDYMNRFSQDGKYISYKPQFSNPEIAVYKTSSGKGIIALRGSATSDDWLKTNPNILAGDITKSQRYQVNKELIEQIRKDMNVSKPDLTIVGHSLAGTEAMAIATENGYKGVGFNSASSPAMIAKDPLRNKYGRNVVNFFIPGDPVSTSSLFVPGGPRNVSIPHANWQSTSVSDLYDKHKIDNFIESMGSWQKKRSDLFSPGADTFDELHTGSGQDWDQIPLHRVGGRLQKDDRSTISKITSGIIRDPQYPLEPLIDPTYVGLEDPRQPRFPGDPILDHPRFKNQTQPLDPLIDPTSLIPEIPDFFDFFP